MNLDPRINAVRGDLADIRLADRVFAPHYAAPMQRPARIETVLRDRPNRSGNVLATLPAGATFEVLDLLDAFAWGVAVDAGLVGYIACEDLELRT